jgi:hypothetical protein
VHLAWRGRGRRIRACPSVSVCQIVVEHSYLGRRSTSSRRSGFRWSRGISSSFRRRRIASVVRAAAWPTRVRYNLRPTCCRNWLLGPLRLGLRLPLRHDRESFWAPAPSDGIVHRRHDPRHANARGALFCRRVHTPGLRCKSLLRRNPGRVAQCEVVGGHETARFASGRRRLLHSPAPRGGTGGMRRRIRFMRLALAWRWAVGVPGSRRQAAVGARKRSQWLPGLEA